MRASKIPKLEKTASVFTFYLYISKSDIISEEENTS